MASVRIGDMRGDGAVGCVMASSRRLRELEEVMGGADHRPFSPDRVEAAQKELSEGSGCFDLAEDRLDDLLAQSVSAAPPGAAELGRHRGDARAFARLALAGWVAATVARPARCEIGGDAPPGEKGEVGLVAIAGIGRELLRLVLDIAPDRRDERHERAAV